MLAEPADWAAHEAAELDYLQAERPRLLYVAGTRAKDLLVVSRWAGGSRLRPWEPFAPFLTDVPVLRVPDAEAPAPSRVRVTADGARRRRGSPRRLASPPRSAVLARRVRHRHGPPRRPGRPPRPGRQVREPDTGMAWGTLVHALLEHAARGPHRDRAHLGRVARWLTFDNPELRRVVPERSTPSSASWPPTSGSKPASALELRRRGALRRSRRRRRRLATVLHGVIDLAFRTSDGWDLVDYKTDQADLTTLTARYADQVRQYATHWSALTGTLVAYSGLYSVRSGEMSVDLRTG